MQRKAKLVKGGSTIFALLIMGITTFAGGLLVTRASASLHLDDVPSCQMVMGTEGDTRLLISSAIPDDTEDILNGDNGSQKYSLQCKNPQAISPKPTPCVETSTTTCVV